MIGSPSADHSRLFERAPSGGGLSGVEQCHLRLIGRLYKAARERGNAAEPLQKIQCRALGGQDRGDFTAYS